jgi:hypothetical protein
MRRYYGDWTIEVHEILHPSYGHGFVATAYIAKTSGLKEDIHEIGYYGNLVKSHKQMADYAQKLLGI